MGTTAPELQIAGGAGSRGRVVVRDLGSVINIDQGTNPALDGFGPALQLRDGDATLEVSNGGAINMSGSAWLFTVGRRVGATATLDVSSGGRIAVSGNGGGATIGRDAGATGTVNVTGRGSIISLVGDPTVAPGDGSAFLEVGRFGSGTLNLLSGGQLRNAPNGLTLVAREPGSVGNVTVDGTGSVLNVGALLFAGEDFDFDTATSLGPGTGGTATVTVINNGQIVTQPDLSSAAFTSEYLTLQSRLDELADRFAGPLQPPDRDAGVRLEPAGDPDEDDR